MTAVMTITTVMTVPMKSPYTQSPMKIVMKSPPTYHNSNSSIHRNSHRTRKSRVKSKLCKTDEGDQSGDFACTQVTVAEVYKLSDKDLSQDWQDVEQGYKSYIIPQDRKQEQMINFDPIGHENLSQPQVHSFHVTN